jgi:hypothetical protein
MSNSSRARSAVMRSSTAVRRRHRGAAAHERTTDERFRSSKPVSWAWLDLNQRPHPDRKTDWLGDGMACFHTRAASRRDTSTETKIARVPTGSAAPRAELTGKQTGLGTVWPVFTPARRPAGIPRLKRKSPVYQRALPHREPSLAGHARFSSLVAAPGHGGLIRKSTMSRQAAAPGAAQRSRVQAGGSARTQAAGCRVTL